MIFRATERGDADGRTQNPAESRAVGGRRSRKDVMLGTSRVACALACLSAGAALAMLPADAAAASRRAHVKAKQAQHSATASSHGKQLRADHVKGRKSAGATGARSASQKAAAAREDKPAKAALPGDLGVVQQAVALARKGKLSEAGALVKSIDDPAAHKLVEWTSLRAGDGQASFDRYDAFIRANPHWPGASSSLRRRAEVRLWQERRDVAKVRAFIGDEPTSAIGRLALARALIGAGERPVAERHIRSAWRSGELSAELEGAAHDAFGDMLTRADHAGRMHRRIGAKDFGGALRAANRLGDAAASIVKACAAVYAKSGKARKLLNAAPDSTRGDPGYALCRVKFLLQNDEVASAAEAMRAVPPEVLPAQDTDEWWRARRTLARELLDRGDPKAAYDVVRAAAVPDNPFYRAESHFMPGWIALRFLDDPAAALAHFARVDEGSANPIVLARAAYWRGRACEAAGETDAMRANYAAAARHSTAYYGQLARARLGVVRLELRAPPEPAHGASADVVRAAELLYAVGERDLALSFVTGFAERSDDAAAIAKIAEIAAGHGDARAVLLVGKAGLGRGLPFDVHAFPDIGVPDFTPVGPALERSMVYSIVRTESEFNQRDASHAQAVGLMQVTPEAGRDTAKRFGVGYDWKRLVNDPVYNTQMGAAELAALLKEYRGSYIMSFAGYNAGRGRVQQWVARYGDPRDPKVDPVDWVERIPFSETRNYVQRVMENLQVYRVRFGEGAALTLGPDLGGKAFNDRPGDPDPQVRRSAAE